MKRSFLVGFLGLGLMVATTTDAQAQLTNMPTYAVPSAYGMPASAISVDFGRGLNETSGKQNAFGVAYVRTGIANRVGIAVGANMINYDPDAKYSFGGDVSVDLLDPDADVQIGVQGGLGYLSLETDYSTINVPIGVAVKGQEAGESTTFGWWFMPRLHYARYSFAGFTDSSTDFGASGGASVTMSSGFGIHAAVDLLAADESVWVGGVGVHYVIN